MHSDRTQVAIIGAGPAGLLLQQLLRLGGVESVVLERQTRAHVEARIRAGVLEPGTVALLEKAGVAGRLHREGLVHEGVELAVDGRRFRIDLRELTGDCVTVYGQTEITHDLFAAADAHLSPIVYEAEHVLLHDLDGERPYVTWEKHGVDHRIDCDHVAGCDGQHGASRAALPTGVTHLFERHGSAAWLGVLADVPPCAPELIYAESPRGFALASMRSSTRSRYYLQVDAHDALEDWPEARFWEELARRLGPDAAAHLTPDYALERSIVPLRSHVIEPMQWGRLFLAGDAAHVVPPTGAKGLNLAAADVGLLADALIAWHKGGGASLLATYSGRALARAWKAVRFSWWFTGLTHRAAGADPFDLQLQRAELDQLRTSRAAQTLFAENYVGRFA